MYTNYPFGVCLAHNGNLTNIKELRESVFAEGRHINTDSVRKACQFLIAWPMVVFVFSICFVLTSDRWVNYSFRSWFFFCSMFFFAIGW